MFKGIKTYKQFIEWIVKNNIKVGVQSPEDIAYWFVAMMEAHLVFDSYTTGDVARLFLDGVPSINVHPEKVTEFFATYWEDVDYTEAELKEASENTREYIREEIPKIIEMQRIAFSNHFAIEIE